MISKKLIDEVSNTYVELQKNDPGLSRTLDELYDRFQIYWKNIRPRSIFLRVLIPEQKD